MAHFLS
ncbi:Protein of unknown function [Lactobacillus delbrueckii subsp. lactis]|nr:Protein of unknown function [Lactobacillus delbrueckii subsp. lactis]